MKKQSGPEPGLVGDRFTLNGGQTGHVARRGLSRSKAPTPAFLRPTTSYHSSLPVYASFISNPTVEQAD